MSNSESPDPFYNIEDFGADTGASAATNTDAIQQAIDDAEAAGGGIVFVPAGTFTVNQIFGKTGVSLMGVGPKSKLLLAGGQSPLQSVVLYKNVSDFFVADLTFDGNAPNQGDTDIVGFQVSNCERFEVRSCHATGANGRENLLILASHEGTVHHNVTFGTASNDGIELMNQCREIVVANNLVFDSPSGIETNPAGETIENVTITNNVIRETGVVAGIDVHSGGNKHFNINDNVIINSGGRGIQIQGRDASTFSEFITVSENTIVNPARAGINSTDPNNRRNKFIGNTIRSAGADGIQAAGKSAIVSDNLIDDTQGRGVLVLEDGTQVKGNTIQNTGQQGISLQSVSDCVVASNVVSGTGKDAISLSGVGIDVTSNRCDGLINVTGGEGHRVSGSRCRGIKINGIPNCIVTENQIERGPDGRPGIKLRADSHACQILGNQINNPAADGIEAWDSNDFVLADNVIENADGEGVDMRAADGGTYTDFAIRGNRIRGSAGSGITVRIASGTLDYYLISDNVLRDNASANLNDAAEGPNALVTDNIT